MRPKTHTKQKFAGTDYEDGWYLPSIAELFQIYACRADTENGFDIDTASEALGGNKFEASFYLSSSKFDSGDNYSDDLDFGSGNCGSLQQMHR